MITYYTQGGSSGGCACCATGLGSVTVAVTLRHSVSCYLRLFSASLNLGGESPWCFYSGMGKVLHMICMIFSIPLFGTVGDHLL